MNADARWQSCGKLQQLTIQKSDRLTKSQSVTVHVRFFFAFFPPSALQQLPLYRQTEHKNVLSLFQLFIFILSHSPSQVDSLPPPSPRFPRRRAASELAGIMLMSVALH